jgi:hypothetical protein
MISAGQTYPAPAQQTQGAPYPQPYYQAGPQLMQPQMLPMQASAGGGMNIAVKSDMSAKELKPFMWSQFGLQAGTAVNNMITQGLNYALASQSMSNQLAVAQKYYQTQDNIAGYQMRVALRQMEVQDNAITAQQQMHSNQIRHEEKMAQLEGSTQVRLAAIQQSGMTERAKILSTTDIFSRRSYDMGMPISTGTW